MNNNWSELNKKMQLQLKKQDTFDDGIGTLIELRRQIMDVLLSFRDDIPCEDLRALPFPNANGNHSTTIVWSLWHIFRIEDIVAHTLINGDEQVFFSGGYKSRTASPIITTGNELTKSEMSDFSEKLDTDELYNYISEEKNSADSIINSLTFAEMKRRISQERRKELIKLNVVSSREDAVWLIDYWCGKDVCGLLRMPFSRHWIMHAEACIKIRDKLKK